MQGARLNEAQAAPLIDSQGIAMGIPVGEKPLLPMQRYHTACTAFVCPDDLLASRIPSTNALPPEEAECPCAEWATGQGGPATLLRYSYSEAQGRDVLVPEEPRGVPASVPGQLLYIAPAVGDVYLTCKVGRQRLSCNC